MKNIVFILLLFSCRPEPEFYINGIPYYARQRCVESHKESKWGYHWGYNLMKGKYEFHFGPYTETICTCTVVDTIQIK